VPTYSQELNQSIDPTTRKTCKSCGLYLNQLPIFDKSKNPSVFWVGLSAVQFADDEEKIPLSPFTRSGGLIARIEEPFNDKISFYKTNLVKCLPLHKDKIRYPIKLEMENCFPNFESEVELLKPRLVFLLGKQVASFVANKVSAEEVDLNDKFRFKSFAHNDILFVPIHHPSYILVYKRKFIDDYARGIHSFLKALRVKRTKVYA